MSLQHTNTPLTAQQSHFMQAPPFPSSFNPHQLKSSFAHTDTLTVPKLFPKSFPAVTRPPPQLSSSCDPIQSSKITPLPVNPNHFLNLLKNQADSFAAFPTSTQLTAPHQIPQVSIPSPSPPTPRTGSFLPIPSRKSTFRFSKYALPSSPPPFHH